MAHAILRKAGLRGGGVGGGEGSSVLSFGAVEIIHEIRGISDQFATITTPWVTADTWDGFPEAPGHGFFSATTDLSTCSELKNAWFVIPGYAHPDVNIRVQASLDGLSWDYATVTDGDWRFLGASVNCAGWYTYTPGEVPYENYPGYYSERVGVENAFPAGLIQSEWQLLKGEYRTQVHLRWLLEWSHSFDDDPIYTSQSWLALGYGDVRAR